MLLSSLFINRPITTDAPSTVTIPVVEAGYSTRHKPVTAPTKGRDLLFIPCAKREAQLHRGRQGGRVRGTKASVNLPREGSKVSARNFSAPLRSLPAEHIVITAWVNFGEAVVAG